MSTWEERMAARTAGGKAAAEEERERQEAEEQALIAVEFPAIEGEAGRAETSGEHYGHRVHQCPWHLWGMMCSCGTLLYPNTSLAITDDMPEPDPCPVCVARGVSPVGR